MFCGGGCCGKVSGGVVLVDAKKRELSEDLAEIGACEMLGDGCKARLADDSAEPNHLRLRPKRRLLPPRRARSTLKTPGPS